jgi:hypothetical protein
MRHDRWFGELSPRQLILGLILALGVRLLCLAVVQYRFDVGDASSYLATSRTLRQQGTYSFEASPPFTPTAYRPPGYPAFLAATSTVVGDTPRALQWVQILLSLITVLAVVALAARVAPGSEKWTLLLAAANPFEAVYAGALLSECLTTFLLVVSVAAMLLLRGAMRFVATGLLCGLLCLCRDIYVALLPFAAVAWIAWGERSRARRVRVAESAAVLCFAALAILPWTVRNAMHFQRFIPISAGRLGYSLWLGGWATTGDFTANDALGIPRQYPDVAFLSDAERQRVDAAARDVAAGDGEFRDLFVHRVRTAPVGVLRTWLARLPRLWLGTRFDIFELHPILFPRGGVAWNLVKASLFALNAALVSAMLIGAVLAFRRGLAVKWAIVPVAFTTLVYMPLNSFENRYSQPMLPLVNLLAGVAIMTASIYVRSRTRTGVPS